MDEKTNLLQSRYDTLAIERETYLNRARDVAALTIPTLLDPVTTNNPGSLSINTPWQSHGARGVNNLASKLLLALFPPNAPNFKLQLDDYVFDQEATEMGEDPTKVKAEFQEDLSGVERAVMAEVDSKAYRSTIFELLKHLLVTGNALWHFNKDGQAKLFHLDRYVVCRDPMGNMMEIIIKETYSGLTLPRELIPLLPEEESRTPDKTFEVYTCVRRTDNGDFDVWQEFKNMEVPESRGLYKKDMVPWIALRGVKKDGEHYGRGYVEEYAGDLRTLEGLQQSIAEGVAASTKLVWLVNPGGLTRIRSLMQARNGDAIPGREGDVTSLQADKAVDLQVAERWADKLQDKLGFAFLLNSSVQRNAERVTAAEIRQVAQELEDALGGMYSILGIDFLIPFTNIVMSNMEAQGKLPKLRELRKKELIKPTLVVGLSALGRGHDLNKLQAFIQIGNEALGPDVFGQYTHKREILMRLAASTGIDAKGLIKSLEDLQADAAAIAAEQNNLEQQPINQELVKGMVKSQTQAGPPNTGA